MTIIQLVSSYHKDLNNDPNHRFRSWEHCYKFFQSKPKNKDIACLHLAFYLASWGMYRGSSFLLKKDYKIHENVIDKILSSEYQILNAITLENFLKKDNVELLFDLIELIKNEYQQKETSRKATDTLVTKILLGTLGCVPAYDRYFIAGIKSVGLPYSYLNIKNYSYLIDWCMENTAALKEAQNEVVSNEISYPIMKIVDMYFWSLGRDNVSH